MCVCEQREKKVTLPRLIAVDSHGFDDLGGIYGVAVVATTRDEGRGTDEDVCMCDGWNADKSLYA